MKLQCAFAKISATLFLSKGLYPENASLSVSGCRLLGKAFFLSGQLDKSEQAYERATSLNGDSPAAWRGLAELHHKTGVQAKLADAFRKLVRPCLERVTCSKLRRRTVLRRGCTVLVSWSWTVLLFSLFSFATGKISQTDPYI